MPDSAPCAIAFATPTYTAVESDGVAQVCLMLFGQPDMDVSVDLETVPGSGSATGL